VENVEWQSSISASRAAEPGALAIPPPTPSKEGAYVRPVAASHYLYIYQEPCRGRCALYGVNTMVERMSFDTSMATVKIDPCLRCGETSLDKGRYCSFCISDAGRRGFDKRKLKETTGSECTWWATKDAVGFGTLPEGATAISRKEAGIYFCHLDIEYEEYSR